MRGKKAKRLRREAAAQHAYGHTWGYEIHAVMGKQTRYVSVQQFDPDTKKPILDKFRHPVFKRVKVQVPVEAQIIKNWGWRPMYQALKKHRD